MDQSEVRSKTMIAEDIEIVGSIKSASDIQLDGKLNGDLNCNGRAVVGKTASVKGNVNADSAAIMGQVNGNIVAKDLVELKSTGKLTGDLRGKRLVVEDGATFVGKSEVNPSGAATSRPSPEPTSSQETAEDDKESEDAKQKPGIFGKK